MNRVNGIYEKEVSIRMVLVANNDELVYTNADTDPYTNDDGETLLDENQENIDNVIGAANYDIGHVFSTGGGGVAGLGVPCRSGFKAQGVTGSPMPTGDAFDVDYVAHEMGHQFGAEHTFNADGPEAGSCGSNRSETTGYEPGSGSTIVAYAGICDTQDLQANSDPYFHGASLDQILAYVTTGAGNTCDDPTPTGNTAPTVDAGATYNIPAETPFVLTGAATDAEGHPLTYGWEEFDLGPAALTQEDNTDDDGQAQPIFRSFNPSISPQRTFPRPADIINNTTTFGEDLPSFNRTMNFRLTVRDNQPGGGGVNNDSTQVIVTDTGTPFLVTAPNTAVSWNAGSSQTVTWNVAGTTATPISCATVNILLSTDGGTTFSATLANGTANDGTEPITVPDQETTMARVRVQCATSIFFDISNQDFTILPMPPTSVTVSAVGAAPATSWLWVLAPLGLTLLAGMLVLRRR